MKLTRRMVKDTVDHTWCDGCLEGGRCRHCVYEIVDKIISIMMQEK
jgi:hypothetical protein